MLVKQNHDDTTYNHYNNPFPILQQFYYIVKHCKVIFTYCTYFCRTLCAIILGNGHVFQSRIKLATIFFTFSEDQLFIDLCHLIFSSNQPHTHTINLCISQNIDTHNIPYLTHCLRE